MKNLWFGYRYAEGGGIQVKRYFGIEDIVEAKQSPFVHSVRGPFEADSREEAYEKYLEVTKNES